MTHKDASRIEVAARLSPDDLREEVIAIVGEDRVPDDELRQLVARYGRSWPRANLDAVCGESETA